MQKNFLACNLYVSAGKKSHVTFLVDLLERTQFRCRSRQCSVVHAFADPVYNRSSFHLAGQSKDVVSIATNLATDAIKELEVYKSPEAEPCSSTITTSCEHPFVGVVDHIAVMPLVMEDGSNHPDEVLLTTTGTAGREIGESLQRRFTKELLQIHFYGLAHPNGTPLAQIRREKTAFFNSGSLEQSSLVMEDGSNHPDEVLLTTTGTAGREIGESLQRRFTKELLQIHFYGLAHPNGTPLAQIRREKTAFFNSGSLEQSSSLHTAASSPVPNVCIVGATPHFVENYNIRLAATCDRDTARSLTRRIRDIQRDDTGRPLVEALTLPYSQGQWEVGCNLLRPDVVGADSIRQEVQLWEQEHHNRGSSILEKSYRVGTTQSECLYIASLQDAETRRKHDAKVMERFRNYFLPLDG